MFHFSLPEPFRHAFGSPRKRTGRKRPARLRTRPLLEVLEDRAVPATFTVLDTDDNGGVDPAVGAGTGTLRQAIIDANANTGTDTIAFAIAGAGLHTITLAAPLPNLG